MTRPVTLTIPIARTDAANHHPSIDVVLRNGEPWPAPPAEVLEASGDGCPKHSSVPAVESGKGEHSLVLRVAEGSRERFVAPEGDPPEPEEQRESLLVSHLSTAGELEGQFSRIEGESTQARVQWKVPSGNGSDDGQLVRFYFVVRDGRGGTARAARAICVR